MRLKDQAQYSLYDWCVFRGHHIYIFSLFRFALKCKLSERVLSLYNQQLIYIPNLYFSDMTHVDWALKKAVIYPVLLHVTIFMVMGD